MPAEDVTLYAQWTDVYTVTYEGNESDGGTVPTDSTNYNAGVTVTVATAGTMTRTGYTFAGGWNTAADGSGTAYAAGSTFNMPVGGVTLYAQWSILSYSVTYDANGSDSGSVPVDVVAHEYGSTVTVLGNTGNLVKMQDGLSLFFTWNTQADGNGTDCEVGTGTFTMGAVNITLFANWTAIRAIGPAGGLVFYDKGFYTGTPSWRYLEAAPSDQSTGIQWYNGTSLWVGTSSTTGAGMVNTPDIVAVQGAGSYAAQLCNDLTIGIYSDWFLPSNGSTSKMYNNLFLKGVGGFESSRYWSSNESSTYAVWHQDFSNGTQSLSYKDNIRRVRAVRAF